MKEVSLCTLIENARADMTGQYERIFHTSGLPAYLFEGIIVGILADVREKKNFEIALENVKSEEVEASEEIKESEVLENGKH